MDPPSSVSSLAVRVCRYDETSRGSFSSGTTLAQALAGLSFPKSKGAQFTADNVRDSTLYPPKELGPLSTCLDQTLDELGMWPAGSLDLVFQGDEGPSWCLGVKSVAHPNDAITVDLLRPLDSVHILKCRIGVKRPALAPASSLIVVYGGNILADGSTLVACGLRLDPALLPHKHL